MTPRESLEAAGWTYRRTIFYKVSKWVHPKFPDRFYDEREALEIIARDKAKETSDVQRSGNVNCIGNVDRHGSTANPPDSNGTAPVATSVSAPDDLDRVATWLDLPEHQIGLPTHKHGNDCGGHTPFTAGSCLRCAVEIAMAAYAREYSSSSSAAPKWDENGILWWAGIGHISVFQRNQDVRKIEAERDALRDSRNRLQEALRAAANHLHYVGQEQAAGQARAALGDPPEQKG